MTAVSVSSGDSWKDREDITTFSTEDNSEDKECSTIVSSVVTSKDEECVANVVIDISSEDTEGVGTISDADVSGDEECQSAAFSDDNSKDATIEDISMDADGATADSNADTCNSDDEEGKTTVSNSTDTEDNSVDEDCTPTVSNFEDILWSKEENASDDFSPCDRLNDELATFVISPDDAAKDSAWDLAVWVSSLAMVDSVMDIFVEVSLPCCVDKIVLSPWSDSNTTSVDIKDVGLICSMKVFDENAWETVNVSRMMGVKNKLSSIPATVDEDEGKVDEKGISFWEIINVADKSLDSWDTAVVPSSSDGGNIFAGDEILLIPWLGDVWKSRVNDLLVFTVDIISKDFTDIVLLPSGNNVDSGETVVDFTDVALFWGESSKCKDNEGIAVDSALKNKEIGVLVVPWLIDSETYSTDDEIVEEVSSRTVFESKVYVVGRMVCPPLKNESTNVIMVDWPLVDPKLSSENE